MPEKPKPGDAERDDDADKAKGPKKISVPATTGLPPAKKPEPPKISVPRTTGLPPEKKPAPPKISVPTTTGLPPEKKPAPPKISVPTTTGLPPEKKPAPPKISVPTTTGLPPEKKPAAPKITVPTTTGLPPTQSGKAAPAARASAPKVNIPVPAATPEAVQELTTKISSLQSRLNSVRDDAMLSYVKDDVEDTDTNINGLTTLLQEVRAQGYAFGGELEGKIGALGEQWPKTLETAQNTVNQHAETLQESLQTTDEQFAHLNTNRGNFAVAYVGAATLEATLSTLESNAEAAQRAIRGTYDNIRNEITQIKSRLDGVKRMLQSFAEATFKLLAGEAPIAAVEAKWDKDGTDQDPRGILYLSDQRIFFEQKEEVATKKVLFIATDKQRVHQLLLESPVFEVRQATASKKGLLGNEDHLDVVFEPGQPISKAHFHINGQDSNLWQGLIGRAKTRDFDKERAVKVDQEVLDKISNAPSQCPNCGGALPTTLLRGQTEIKCEFCGTVIRL